MRSFEYDAILRQVDAERAIENRLIDEYLALPDRPKKMTTIALTSVHVGVMQWTVDLAHWDQWRAERKSGANA